MSAVERSLRVYCDEDARVRGVTALAAGRMGVTRRAAKLSESVVDDGSTIAAMAALHWEMNRGGRLCFLSVLKDTKRRPARGQSGDR